jgi:hypothetical protein
MPVDDLERAVTEQLRQGSESIVPSADAPDRIRRRVFRRQRRRRAALASVPAACLLIALAVFVSVGHPGRGGSPSSPVAGATGSSLLPGPTAVTGPGGPGPHSAAGGGDAPLSPGPANSSATPGGWVPVDLADARISVPPGAVESSAGCPDPHASVTVFLRNQAAPPGISPCLYTAATTSTVTLSVLPRGAPTTGLPSSTVHGITVFQKDGSDLVPALGVEVSVFGPYGAQVLGTLTRSPRAVALRGGRAPRVPAAWRQISFGGLHLAAPRAWPVRHVVTWGPICHILPPWQAPGLDAPQPSVTLDAGNVQPMVACPALALASAQPVEAPTDGVVVDRGPVGPLGDGPVYGPCRSIHGLRTCVDQDFPYGQLVMRVMLPNRRKVALAVGLGDTGQTARTILASLRPA